MKITQIRTITILLVLLAISVTTPARATTIATLDVGSYAQSGTLTNMYSSNITNMQINFVPDSGGNTAIYDTGLQGSAGTPTPDFSNSVPGLDSWFTATYNGLNVANGGTFLFSDLDYDGFDSAGISNVGNGTTTAFDGSEYVMLTFADGSSVSSFMPLGVPSPGFRLLFDSADLTSVVPVPAAVWLFGSGLIGLVGLARRKA